MSDTVDLPDDGLRLPELPPNVVVLRAERQAKALARSIYVYRHRSAWVMTTDVCEAPSNAAVWMFPANRNDPERHNLGGN
jgi:hypothetical protein